MIGYNEKTDSSAMQACESQWYAVYTCSRQEKKVASQLTVRSFENFLPLYPSIRTWTDRRVRLELPLFPGYVFVRLALTDRVRVLQAPGVVHFVGFNGQPAALPDEDINVLRNGLIQGGHAEPDEFLREGQKVRIATGPFAGLQGILRRRNGRTRVVVSIAAIERCFAVEVEHREVRELKSVD